MTPCHLGDISCCGCRLDVASPSGMAKNAMFGKQVFDAANKIPNMSKDDAGHALGYGTEKIAEAVVITKGAGAVSKSVEGIDAVESTSTFEKIERSAPGSD